MPDGRTGDTGDRDLLLRWGVLVTVLAVGGLFLASRAVDSYTSAFGLLLAGFGVFIGFRLVTRVTG